MGPAARRPSSSFRQPASWLVVVAGLAGYVGLVFALTRYRVTLTLPPLPWWALQAAPPLLYGLLIVLCLRRVTPGGFLGGTLVLWAAHILLGTLTPLLAAVFDPLNHGRMLSLTFPPPPLPQMAVVPLLLVPLRSVLAPKSPIRRGDRPSGVGVRRATLDSAAHVAVPSPLSAPAPEAVSEAATEVPGWARSRPAWPLAQDEAAPAPPQESVSPDPDPEMERAAIEVASKWEARMSAPKAAPPEIAEDAVVRIPFSRIAAQFSTDTFLLPLDRVAASLPEPGVVTVPIDCVLPQLGEGLVTVAWDIVANQFPRDVLAITDDEVKTGLREGGLVLPLDEVVSQLPHELFAATGSGPDVRGIESYPAPFQPFAPEQEAHAAPVSEIAPAVAAASEEAQAVVTEPTIPPPAEAVAESILEAPEAPGHEPVVPPTVGDDADVVWISFDRIASQLPGDSFLLPLDRVGANLTDPGRLRIPRALVLPQLGEGEVRVPWDVVVRQLPRQLLAVSEEELARQFADDLLLPLDEVIRQFPPETFAAAGPGPDVRQLESFPAPFQPLVPEAQPSAETTAAPVEFSPIEEPAPQVEPAPMSFQVEPEPEFAPEPAPMSFQVEPEPVPEPAAAVDASIEIEEEEPPTLVLGDESLEPPHFDLEPLTATEHRAEPLAFEPDEEAAPVLEIPDLEPEPALMEQLQAELAAAAASAAPETEAPPVEPAPTTKEPTWVAAETAAVRPEALGAARRIAALMAPMTSLGVEAKVVNGVTVFTLASPGVPDELALTAARLMLPLLAVGHAPWPVDQLTLRGPSAALVFTPLGVPDAPGPMLVAAVAQSGSLALLEILCRRAAAAFTATGESGGPAASGNGGGRPELIDMDLPVRARQIAATLGALGPVTAAALREAAGTRALYLFLPSGTDAREVGGFALEVGRAMAKATAEGAAFQVAVVRSGQRCLVIRPDAGSGDRPHTVVAAGETAKPGLAFRQVERAVAALGSA